MAGLGTYIARFLAADGFDVTRAERGHVIAERRTDGGLERRQVWYVDPEAGMKADEARLLAAFREPAAAEAADSQAFLVVPSLGGLSNDFRAQASAAGVGVRVPIQFFDTPYKSDGGDGLGGGRGEAASVFAEFVRDNAHIREARVPQPYVALSGLGEARGGFAAGGDLFEHLNAELSEPPAAAAVHVVIGSAGAGKSYLFAALFDALHRHFLSEKRAHRLASRPILFLPAHIREATTASLDGLLAAVAQTDAAMATGPGLMRWLNANGLTTWMFDGLDEFFAGEVDFVAELDKCLAAGSRSRVVICARDSLLTSSNALRSFIDRNIGGGGVKLYELSRWERPSQRGLAWLRREGRLPAEGEADPPAVKGFLAALDGSATLSELATLPYYCDLLLAIEADPKGAPADEFDLIGRAVDALIDREAEKLASGELGFEWDVFSGAEAFVEAAEMIEAAGREQFASPESRQMLHEALAAIGRERLVELIEGIAHRMRMLEPYPNEGQGVPIGELEQMAAFYLDVGLPAGIEPRVLLAIVQLAFFGPGSEKGHVRFTHEIIADYLAARHAMAQIRANPDSADHVGQALGVRRDLDRTVFLRYLVRELSRDRELAQAVAGHLDAGRIREAYRDNVRLLVTALGGRA